VTERIQPGTPAPTGPSKRALAGALAVALLLVAAVFHPLAVTLRRGEASSFVEYNRARLASFAEVPAEEPKIVALGTSTLKTAVATWREAPVGPTPARSGGDSGPLMLRLVDHGPIFSDFAPLLDDIRAAGPDLIVIETAVLARTRSALGWWRTFLDGRAILAGRANADHYIQHGNVCGRTAEEEGLDLGHFAVAHSIAAVSAESDPHLALTLKRWRQDFRWRRDSGAARLAADFIRAATADGIPVVLLDIPLAPRLEARMPEDWRLGREVAAILSTETPGVAVWRAPRLDASHFCETTHFNTAGRQAFTAWITRRFTGSDAGPGPAIRRDAALRRAAD